MEYNILSEGGMLYDGDMKWDSIHYRYFISEYARFSHILVGREMRENNEQRNRCWCGEGRSFLRIGVAWRKFTRSLDLNEYKLIPAFSVELCWYVAWICRNKSFITGIKKKILLIYNLSRQSQQYPLKYLDIRTSTHQKILIFL